MTSYDMYGCVHKQRCRGTESLKQLVRALHYRLADDETQIPLMDQDVGDDRGVRRPPPAAFGVIARFQLLQLLLAGWRSEKRLQFHLPLLESLRKEPPYSVIPSKLPFPVAK